MSTSESKGEIVNILDVILDEKLEDLGDDDEGISTTSTKRSTRVAKPTATSTTVTVIKRPPPTPRGLTFVGKRSKQTTDKEEPEPTIKSVISSSNSYPKTAVAKPKLEKPKSSNMPRSPNRERAHESKSNFDIGTNGQDSKGKPPNVEFDDTRSDVSSSDVEDSKKSLSSASLSDADLNDVKDNPRTSKVKEPIKAPSYAEPSSSNDVKDVSTKLSFILRDARFFLMKSNNVENIDLSKLKSVWSTPPANESRLNQAVKETRNIYLIFSVKESGKFSGFARVAGPSVRGGEPVNWILPPGLSQRALGGVFDLDWISTQDLSFTRTQHLFNPWNEGKPVKIGRDGQEIEPHVAAELCRLFPSDTRTDWDRVMRKSRDAASRISSTRISGPIGSAPPNSSTRGRGGFRDNREPRGRFNQQPPTVNSYRSPIDYGRGTGRKRHYPEEDFRTQPKRSRSNMESYYSQERRSESDMNQRYTRDRSYAKGYSSYDQHSAEYHSHRAPPPPMPQPYPPPPPFDKLPLMPPRYYDGPPLPEFSLSRESARPRRSVSPYEKSVSEFLRRTSHRDRAHHGHGSGRDKYMDRSREHKYSRR